jgi:hypothetical protein
MVVLIMLAFFLLSSQTVFIRFGRYDLYLREYALFFAVFIITLALFIFTKVRFIYMFNENLSPLAILQQTTYFIPWLIQRIFLLAFWALATYSGFKAFQDQLYNPRKLIR